MKRSKKASEKAGRNPKGSAFSFYKLAFLLAAAAYAVSLVHIFKIRQEEGAWGGDGKTIIRLAHNLMEKSVEDAFNSLAREYESIHPEVNVIIQAIPKRAYKQWLNTQLLSANPPDLVQLGEADSANVIGATLKSKYAEIITTEVSDPNPYNAGTPLEGVQWRDTYIDGMQGGYDSDLLEFYSVPLTLHTSRIFYNKDLFEKITGSDQPPRDFQEWMDICAAVRAYAKTEGKEIFPIAATRTDASQRGFFSFYFPALTGGMMFPFEHHAEGVPSSTTTLFALRSGNFRFNNPRIRAAFSLQRELARNFQPGFASDLGDQTRFLFIQEHAAMVVGNTLDVMLYGKTAPFRVGIFPLPLPRKDNPRYGKYVVGPAWEAVIAGFSFAVTRLGKNHSLALDFLRFCTSLPNNEKFCRRLNWYPVIRGAETAEVLKIFTPNTEGVSEEPTLTAGPEMNLYFDQNYVLYLGGFLSFDDFIKGLQDSFLTKGADWVLVRRDIINRQNLHSSERTLARSRSKMLFREAGDFLPGRSMGSGTQYQVGIYTVLAHFAAAFSYRQYITPHLKDGSYAMPPLSEMPAPLFPTAARPYIGLTRRSSK